MASSSHMVDEFEKAFQNSLALMSSQEYFNIETDGDEIRASVEQSAQKFIDTARQLDTFFLQRRIALCSSKEDSSPVKEDLEDLRMELQRKDALIQKHWEKLLLWQSWFKYSHGSQGTSSSSGTPPGQIQGTQAGQQQPQPGTPQQGSFASGLMASSAPAPSHSAAYNQGPLAYLEQTTSSIGLPRMN